MSWSEIPQACPLSMSKLLSFMERWQEGSTRELKGASVDTIEALATPLKAVGRNLPNVYREFLETMGESMGELRLTWGTTLASELLADLQDPDRVAPDPMRYFKFSIGEEDINGRHPDDFFDLDQPTADGCDAAVIRVHEKVLVSGGQSPEQPFATFSDLVRSVVVSKLGLKLGIDRSTFSFGFGEDPEAPARVYAFLLKLGFEVSELGASVSITPMEAVERGAIALLMGSSSTIPRTNLMVRARDEKQRLQLKEVITDHQLELRG